MSTIETYKKPEHYKNSMNDLKSQVPTLLEEFKKAYVQANTYPNEIDIQNNFDNINNSLNMTMTVTKQLIKEVTQSTTEMNHSLLKLNSLIKDNKIENKKLSEELGEVEERNIASDELIDDYQYMYNYEYLKNLGLVLSILFSLSLIKRSFQ
jgi:predicted nuclease with TOPRIM domain